MEDVKEAKVRPGSLSSPTCHTCRTHAARYLATGPDRKWFSCVSCKAQAERYKATTVFTLLPQHMVTTFDVTPADKGGPEQGSLLDPPKPPPMPKAPAPAKAEPVTPGWMTPGDPMFETLTAFATSDGGLTDSEIDHRVVATASVAEQVDALRSKGWLMRTGEARDGDLVWALTLLGWRAWRSGVL